MNYFGPEKSETTVFLQSVYFCDILVSIENKVLWLKVKITCTEEIKCNLNKLATQEFLWQLLHLAIYATYHYVEQGKQLITY